VEQQHQGFSQTPT